MDRGCKAAKLMSYRTTCQDSCIQRLWVLTSWQRLQGCSCHSGTPVKFPNKNQQIQVLTMLMSFNLTCQGRIIPRRLPLPHGQRRQGCSCRSGRPGLRMLGCCCPAADELGSLPLKWLCPRCPHPLTSTGTEPFIDLQGESHCFCHKQSVLAIAADCTSMDSQLKIADALIWPRYFILQRAHMY